MFDFIDIEASSLHPSNSYPIEIGSSADGGFSFLIKPHESWIDWSNDAEQNIHHISRKSLIESGCEIKQVCIDLNQRLLNKILYSDAYENDQWWIKVLFDKSKIQRQFKVMPLDSLLNNLEISAKKFWNIRQEIADQNQLHRAQYDANLSKKVILKCLGL